MSVKKQSFAARAAALCRKLGAVDKEGSFREGGELVIKTVHGLLNLFPCDGAIRTRFDEKPSTPPSGPPLNPYSFKWNFEFAIKRSAAQDADDLEYFERSLRKLLVRQNEKGEVFA